jgi:UDP-N-acetylglucosamine 2-epimerase (non-hydrolysing)
MTLHRAENVDDKEVLNEIIEGINSLDIDIVFAAHPRTVQKIKHFSLLKKLEENRRIHLIEPPEYLDFINLMQRCEYVLTDSGGIQEEVTSPSINKRVFVLRKSTERPEAVNSGHAIVVGTTSEKISQTIQESLKSQWKPKEKNPYGKGDAAKKIIDLLEIELS